MRFDKDFDEMDRLIEDMKRDNIVIRRCGQILLILLSIQLALAIFGLLAGCAETDDPITVSPTTTPQTVQIRVVPELADTATQKAREPQRPFEIVTKRLNAVAYGEGDNVTLTVHLAGEIRANEAIEIAEFLVTIEPIDTATALTPNDDPMQSGIWYPKRLDAGDVGTWEFWAEYWTDEGVFDGIVYDVDPKLKPVRN